MPSVQFLTERPTDRPIEWTSEFPSAIHSDVFTDHMLKDMWVKQFISHNFAKQKCKKKKINPLSSKKNIIYIKKYEDHFFPKYGG